MRPLKNLSGLSDPEIRIVSEEKNRRFVTFLKVVAVLEDFILAIREKLLPLSDKLADEMSVTNIPTVAAEIARKEVCTIMMELFNYQYNPQKHEERVRERRKWRLLTDFDDLDIEEGEVNGNKERI